ncbi:MAG: AAA family ATPase, partial [Methylococcales bacterium]|nr:AAA family ATPase [Methylococcales bacterium]
MNKLKKLPIGKQTFKDVIDEGNLYIDKTQIALNLIANFKYVFLARPRRFGKSLFLDTLKELFEGNQPLFKGLYADKNYSWDQSYPVIHISFSGGIHNKDDLTAELFSILDDNKQRLQVTCQSANNINLCFKELIANIYNKYQQKVVILIDEYDKPILDNLNNISQALIIRDALRDFYTKIKDADRYIKFAFLTGVSQFSKVSIFSGLNNLEDITLNPQYGSICGYTQQDIESQFIAYLKGVDLEKLKA